MFFRFVAALLLVVLISALGIRLEYETLRLRRTVSRQYYHTDLLLELHAQLRLTTQRLTAPSHPEPGRASALASSRGRNATDIRHTTTDAETDADPESTSLPLLRFRYPVSPRGID